MLICSSCKSKQPLINFYKRKDVKRGYSYYCKLCTINKVNNYTKNNKNKIKVYKDEYNLRHKNKEYFKEYYLKHKEKKKIQGKLYRQNNSDVIKDRDKKYQAKNRSRINQLSNKYAKEKRASCPSFRINKNMSKAVWGMLKDKKGYRSWNSLVGYSKEELIKHLESKFTKGMSWENYGKGGWHVDHIIPRCKFNSADEKKFKQCWDLANLQPLWESTSVAISYGESDKYIGNFEKSKKLINQDKLK